MLRKKLARAFLAALCPLSFIGYWIVLAGFACLVLVTGYQALSYLRSGDWPPLPLASYGLAALGRAAGFADLESWSAAPRSWIGLHRVLDNLSLGFGFFVIGTAAGVTLLQVGLFARGRAVRNRHSEPGTTPSR